MSDYLMRVGSALSQLANVVFLNGHPNESISGRSWRCRWRIRLYIDAFFALFGDPDHCLMSHVNERLWARDLLDVPATPEESQYVD